MARARQLALASLVALLAAAGWRASGAAFTARATNPANTIAAAADFAKLRLATGSYVGNGADDRAIALTFDPDVVMVKAASANEAVMRLTGMAGSKPLGSATTFRANMIQALGPTGIEVGTDPAVNSAGTTYYWQAFAAAAGELETGTYAGTGVAQSVDGLGFSPEGVIVAGDVAESAVMRIAGLSAAYRFDPDNGNPQRITSLDGDGFTVGTGATVNLAGASYHWVAWSATPGRIATGTYTGTGVAREVSGLGLDPGYVVVRAEDRTTDRRPIQRSAAISGDSSLFFDAAGPTSGSITGLGSGAFGVGTAQSVNGTGIPYAYAAFADGGG